MDHLQLLYSSALNRVDTFLPAGSAADGATGALGAVAAEGQQHEHLVEGAQDQQHLHAPGAGALGMGQQGHVVAGGLFDDEDEDEYDFELQLDDLFTMLDEHAPPPTEDDLQTEPGQQRHALGQGQEHGHMNAHGHGLGHRHGHEGHLNGGRHDSLHEPPAALLGGSSVQLHPSQPAMANQQQLLQHVVQRGDGSSVMVQGNGRAHPDGRVLERGTAMAPQQDGLPAPHAGTEQQQAQQQQQQLLCAAGPAEGLQAGSSMATAAGSTLPGQSAAPLEAGFANSPVNDSSHFPLGPGLGGPGLDSSDLLGSGLLSGLGTIPGFGSLPAEHAHHAASILGTLGDVPSLQLPSGPLQEGAPLLRLAGGDGSAGGLGATTTAAAAGAGSALGTGAGTQLVAGTRVEAGTQVVVGTQAGAGTQVVAGTQDFAGARALASAQFELGMQVVAETQAGAGTCFVAGTQAGAGTSVSAAAHVGTGTQAEAGTQVVAGTRVIAGTGIAAGTSVVAGTVAATASVQGQGLGSRSSSGFMVPAAPAMVQAGVVAAPLMVQADVVAAGAVGGAAAEAGVTVAIVGEGEAQPGAVGQAYPNAEVQLCQAAARGLSGAGELAFAGGQSAAWAAGLPLTGLPSRHPHQQHTEQTQQLQQQQQQQHQQQGSGDVGHWPLLPAPGGEQALVGGWMEAGGGQALHTGTGLEALPGEQRGVYNLEECGA